MSDSAFLIGIQALSSLLSAGLSSQHSPNIKKLRFKFYDKDEQKSYIVDRDDNSYFNRDLIISYQNNPSIKNLLKLLHTIINKEIIFDKINSWITQTRYDNKYILGIKKLIEKMFKDVIENQITNKFKSLNENEIKKLTDYMFENIFNIWKSFFDYDLILFFFINSFRNFINIEFFNLYGWDEIENFIQKKDGSGNVISDNFLDIDFDGIDVSKNISNPRKILTTLGAYLKKDNDTEKHNLITCIQEKLKNSKEERIKIIKECVSKNFKIISLDDHITYTFLLQAIINRFLEYRGTSTKEYIEYIEATFNIDKKLIEEIIYNIDSEFKILNYEKIEETAKKLFQFFNFEIIKKDIIEDIKKKMEVKISKTTQTDEYKIGEKQMLTSLEKIIKNEEYLQKIKINMSQDYSSIEYLVFELSFKETDIKIQPAGIQTAGSNKFYNKYLKYKTKYLELQHNLDKIHKKKL
jgi:hypothetical protein